MDSFDFDNMAIDDTRVDNIKNSGELFCILVEIMKKLRSDNGCMWDKEQTHESIKKNIIEEAYEAVESIEDKNYEDLKEELGDILLQVVFHSQIAVDTGEFDLNGVIRTIIKKLIRRHPHVFSGKSVESSSEVLSNWEDIKKKERKKKYNHSKSIFANIPKILPSLHYAYEIQNRASRLGFDWDSADGVIDKINEELLELSEVFHKDKDKEKNDNDNERLMDEIGDLLFSIVNFSRHLKVDSEQCLRDTCRKFIRRFDYMEKYAEENGIDFKSLPLSEKDKLWELAKNNF